MTLDWCFLFENFSAKGHLCSFLLSNIIFRPRFLQIERTSFHLFFFRFHVLHTSSLADLPASSVLEVRPVRFLLKNVPFVLFSHHGLPSVFVFFSCFGFLRWNCRFPKNLPVASLFSRSFLELFHGWLLFLLWNTGKWKMNFSVCALFYDDAQVLFSEDLWNCLLYRLLPCDYMLSQIICTFKPQYCIN